MEVHFVCGSIKGMLGTIFTNSLFQNVRWQVLIQNVNLKEIKKKKTDGGNNLGIGLIRWITLFHFMTNGLKFNVDGL